MTGRWMLFHHGEIIAKLSLLNFQGSNLGKMPTSLPGRAACPPTFGPPQMGRLGQWIAYETLTPHSVFPTRMLISGALFSPDHPQRTGSRERISHVSWSRISIFNCEGSIDKAGEAACDPVTAQKTETGSCDLA